MYKGQAKDRCRETIRETPRGDDHRRIAANLASVPASSFFE